MVGVLSKTGEFGFELRKAAATKCAIEGELYTKPGHNVSSELHWGIWGSVHWRRWPPPMHLGSWVRAFRRIVGVFRMPRHFLH